MAWKRSSLAVLVTIAAMFGCAATAQAAAAWASSTVNVRAGNGTGYPVLDVLRRGERVDVEYCRGAWCFVSKPGPNGWVNANFLTQSRYDDEDEGYYYIERPRPVFRPHFHRPYWGHPGYNSQICVGGSNASFCISD
jgi:uncharacterized protein YraI